MLVEPPAERVGQQLLGHRPGEELGTREERLSQRHDTIDAGAVGELARRVDRRAGVLGAPRAHGVEVLERESDRIHDLVAAGACRIRAVLGHLLPHRLWLLTLLVFLERGHVRRRAGGGVPRMFSRIHLPRTTGEVRVACDVSARMLPWPSSPFRASSVTGTRRKWLP